MHQFVLLSGLPASGKTTLASALALELGFPLLDKDSVTLSNLVAEVRRRLREDGPAVPGLTVPS